MRNLIRAFFFKLSKDWTFRITLFIGLGLAVFMTLLYFALDHFLEMDAGQSVFCNGQSLFIASLSPAQNFGIAIPVNLVTFTVMEFNHGTIRNKIIAGNSKGKIYLSLLLSGLTFTFILMTAYVGLSVGLASIFGGFDMEGAVASGLSMASMSWEFFWKMLVLAILAYALITFMAVFFASIFRSIGPCIPIVVILIFVAYLSATLLAPMAELFEGLETANKVLRVLNPFYSLGYSEAEGGKLVVTNEAFLTEVINTVVYSALFIVGGFLIFKKQDVK